MQFLEKFRTWFARLLGAESSKPYTEVSPVASPLGLSINQYRQQTTAVIDDLVHIIESLEI